jgi:hypothetical protein
MGETDDSEFGDYEPDDEYELDDEDAGAECGRWRNGRLSDSCSKAGSEECDFECPYRDGDGDDE